MARSLEEREAKVRERAEAMWRAEGRPAGRALEHWLLAEKMVALDEGRIGSSQALADLATDLAHERPPETKETAQNHGGRTMSFIDG